MAREIINDYTGRTVDLLIFQFSNEAELRGDVTLSFGRPARIVTGIEKVKQVFTVMLMSEVESVLMDELRGTAYGAAIGQSNFNPDTMQHVSNIAAAQTLNLVIEDQLNSSVKIPPDETLIDAIAEDIIVNVSDPSRVQSVFRLVTAAGDDFQLFLPLAVALTT